MLCNLSVRNELMNMLASQHAGWLRTTLFASYTFDSAICSTLNIKVQHVAASISSLSPKPTYLPTL